MATTARVALNPSTVRKLELRRVQQALARNLTVCAFAGCGRPLARDAGRSAYCCTTCKNLAMTKTGGAA